MAKGKFQVSEAVRARFAGGQRWYTGTVARVDDKKGTFSIAYDDGEHHTYLGALRDMMGRWGGRRGHRLMPYVRAAVSLRTIRRTQMCCVCVLIGGGGKGGIMRDPQHHDPTPPRASPVASMHRLQIPFVASALLCGSRHVSSPKACSRNDSHHVHQRRKQNLDQHRGYEQHLLTQHVVLGPLDPQ